MNCILFAAESPSDDPVCNLVNEEFEENQSFRLCALVLGSSYFKNQINYSNELIASKCYRRKISFRTAEAVEKSRGKLYHLLPNNGDAEFSLRGM
jgi:hypothetical protein